MKISARSMYQGQSHYIDVAQGAIFMRFWAGWQYWKNQFGPIMSNFWGRFFHVFVGKKMIYFLKHCSVYTKKLHNIFFLEYFFNFVWFFWAKNRLNIHNQLCITLLDTPPCTTSMYIMTFIRAVGTGGKGRGAIGPLARF